ncbi:serine/threonine-protein kinase M1, partial [Cryomyces antarcticus]
MHMNSHCQAFSQRCEDENAAVVVQALHELVSWLEKNQQFIHESAVSEQPSPVVGKLTRSVLDACIRFAEDRADIVSLCTQALGMIGCLDPNRVEATRHKRDILVKSNFDRADEVIDFVAFFLERVLVKAFHSVTNARAQGFLAYVMQELLKSCGFDKVATYRPGGSQSNSSYQRWMEIPSTVRSTLTPFLSSRYVLTTSTTIPAPRNYPIFSTKFSHSAWLRAFVFDLLQRGTGVNAKMIFPVLARIIRGHDISISIFLLPFAALNVTVGGTDGEAKDVGKELLTVLEHQGQGAGQFETTKACSENVFQVLDYLSRWMQEKNKELAHMRNVAARMGQSPPELEELTLVKQISSVERVLSGIPAEVIARRAVECGSYARALFHWEQYVRQQKKIASDRGEAANEEFLYQRLQDIYTQIDEPDGIEGISTHLHVLDSDQQVLDHRKAGRWTAAQSWYELELATKPDDVDAQMNLLTCLRESGQFNALLKYVESFDIAPTRSVPQVLSFASEASWMTEKFDLLRKHVAKPSEIMPQDFNVGIGKAMVKILENDQPGFLTALSSLREGVAKGFSTSNTSSLQTCHDHMLKLHTLYEIESLSGLANTQAADPDRAFDWESLDRRLAILGSYMPDKQYLLGVRRAVMKISKLHISELDRASSWLTSARLARKAGLTNTAFNAVLHATQLGDDSAKIEHSRLLWKDGHHRKAIQNLEGAIAVNAFRSHDRGVVAEASHAEDKQQQQNMLTARAHLLLAKWLDTAGQTQSQVITNKYQFAAKTNARWDKGHYYLGKHYNKLLESEKALPRARQSMSFLCGETAKLVIDNYMRSLAFGSKYWYQTVPKILTLWLELGMDVHNASRPAAPDVGIADQRIRILDLVHRQLRKYVDRLPAYIFYTALPQIISRISHPNMKVYEVLSTIILKIVSTHPSQALWSLLAVVKSSSHERAGRGLTLVNKLKASSFFTSDAKRNKSEAASLELRNMIAHGQKLSDHLLQACEVHIESRASTVSLSKDLGFSHRLAPSTLVIPIESTLTATLPTVHNSDYIRRYKAFPQDRVTISSFSDDVLVLASLQRPRKLTVRGSDGKNYGLLCKPKDDLRKDQRLMEFNAMINRALKRDAESSKRRLYIKTYGVTPLSEESGTIEWVDHIKPMRDILLKLYARKGVTPNYNELRTLLTEASADPQNVAIFTEKVLPQFPPALHEYFVETFPEPEA